MARIKGKDTKPEMLVRRFLHKNGFRYRLHVKDLPGKPDIVLPKYKTVIFIHGCFWHGHEGCKYYTVPKTRSEWWLQKITGNVNNDTKAEEILTAQGWKVLKIWGCELKNSVLENAFSQLLTKLK